MKLAGGISRPMRPADIADSARMPDSAATGPQAAAAACHWMAGEAATGWLARPDCSTYLLRDHLQLKRLEEARQGGRSGSRSNHIGSGRLREAEAREGQRAEADDADGAVADIDERRGGHRSIVRGQVDGDEALGAQTLSQSPGGSELCGQRGTLIYAQGTLGPSEHPPALDLW